MAKKKFQPEMVAEEFPEGGLTTDGVTELPPEMQAEQEKMREAEKYKWLTDIFSSMHGAGGFAAPYSEERLISPKKKEEFKKKVGLDITDFITQIAGAEDKDIGNMLMALQKKPQQIGYDFKEISQRMQDITNLYHNITELATTTYDLSNENVNRLLAQKPDVSKERLEFLVNQGALQLDTPEFEQDRQSVIAQTAIGMLGDILTGAVGQKEALPVAPVGTQTALRNIGADIKSHQKSVAKINDLNIKLMRKHRENVLGALKDYDDSFDENERAYMKEKNNLISDLLQKNIDLVGKKVGLQNKMADLGRAITDHKLQVRKANQAAVNAWNTKVLNIHGTISSLNKAAREGRMSLLGGEKRLQDSLTKAAGFDISTQQVQNASNNIAVGNLDPTAFKSFPTIASRSADRAIEAIYNDKELTKKQQGEAMQTYQLLLNQGVVVNPIDIIGFLKRSKGLKVSVPEYLSKESNRVAIGLQVSPEEAQMMKQIADRMKLKDTGKTARTLGNMINVRIPILLAERYDRGEFAKKEAALSERTDVNLTDVREEAQMQEE